MKWNIYQDKENSAYSHILTTLFPEQTKTLPRILVWSLIFLADLILIAAAAAHWGFLDSELLLLAAVFGLFWLQGFLWCTCMKLFR